MVDVDAPQDTSRSTTRLLARRWTAPVVFAVAVLVSLGVWWYSNDFTQGLAADRRRERAEEVAAAIHLRMKVYEQVLWGCVSFMNSSERVTRQEWRTYVESLQIDSKWPGIQGIGYAIPLAPGEVEEHEAAIRAEGFPDYRVHPLGERAEKSAIVYLEPFDWRNRRAFGYDMWSDEMRREAMRRARDEGVAATSGIITLVQETTEDVQRGFLTYVPLYRTDAPVTTREERRRAFRGWVYAPFRAGDLMAGVEGSTPATVDFDLYDGREPDPERRLVAGRSDDPVEAPHAVTVPMQVQGRPWTLRVLSDAPLSTGEQALPWVVLVTGLAIDLLLFVALRSYYTVQRRAEALAARMTRELEEQAQALRARNDELSQFAYVASHDLQEPLRTVANFAEFLEARHADAFDERGRQALTFIQGAAGRMTTLIRGLLDYSRLGADAERTRVDCDALLAQVRDDLAAALTESDADLTWDELPTLEGYETELRRLFQNLIGNAVKFHRPDRPPAVHVSARRVTGAWEFAVADDGIGVEPESAERIFLIFQRLHREGEFEGSGIGLAHCKKIAELHGGSIHVEPAPRGGSVFRFTVRDPGEE